MKYDLPSECAITECHLGDRSGFLCMTQDAIDKTKLALDRIAQAAGVDAVAVDPMYNDRGSMGMDKKGVHHLPGGFLGVGLVEYKGEIFFRQRWVGYNRILTDEEVERIRVVLHREKISDPEAIAPGKKFIIWDEVSDISAEQMMKLVADAKARPGQMIVTVPK